MDNLLIQGTRIRHTIEGLYNSDPQGFLMAVGVAIAVMLIIGFTLHKGKKVPGEDAMNMRHVKREVYQLTKRQLKLREHTLIADGIADLLLELFRRNELTSERYQYWHLRFGTQLALKDLLPQKLTPAQVKEAAQKRINNGVYRPVRIPGEPIKKVRYRNKAEEILALK